MKDGADREVARGNGERGRPAVRIVQALALIPAAAALLGASTHSQVQAQCAWRAIATPKMPRDVADVAALSSSDVWAVGPAPYSENAKSPVIVHWDGRRLDLTRPLGARSDPEVWLSAVAAVSAEDVWAVGANRGQPLLMRWDGTRWQVVSSPRVDRGGELYDVVAGSHTSVWAVGSSGDPARPLVMHWDGRAWETNVLRRSGSLYAVAGAGPRNLWAMGDDYGAGSVNLIDALALRWDGRRWRGFPTPIPDDRDLGHEAHDFFSAVDVVSASGAWAVHDGAASSDVQRWNGRKWRISVRYRNRDLSDVAPVSPRKVWAVGGTSHPLIVHWDGTSWTHATPARLRRLRARLEAVSAVSASEIWAAGPRLLARYSC